MHDSFQRFRALEQNNTWLFNKTESTLAIKFRASYSRNIYVLMFFRFHDTQSLMTQTETLLLNTVNFFH
jgi:hypothetical protein